MPLQPCPWCRWVGRGKWVGQVGGCTGPRPTSCLCMWHILGRLQMIHACTHVYVFIVQSVKDCDIAPVPTPVCCAGGTGDCHPGLLCPYLSGCWPPVRLRGPPLSGSLADARTEAPSIGPLALSVGCVPALTKSHSSADLRCCIWTECMCLHSAADR